MLNNFFVIDNLFDDPMKIVKLAHTQKYYSINEHPRDKNTHISWEGVRTEWLHDVCSENEQMLLQDQITRKMCNTIRTDAFIDIKQDMRMHFHLFTEHQKHRPDWFHTDTTILAGVVYLNKDVIDSPHHGTIVKMNGVDRIIPNRYNRLVAYRGDYIHAPASGFGSNIQDGRLTLNFFIHSLNLSVISK